MVSQVQPAGVAVGGVASEQEKHEETISDQETEMVVAFLGMGAAS